jgi:hypothetical protein
VTRDTPTPSVPPTAIWVALIIGAAGLFTLNRAWFQDVRPTEPPAPLYWRSPGDIQDIEARLWDDPLSVVARARAADSKRDSDPRRSLEPLLDSLRRANVSNLLVLGVFLNGAPYAADIETRRRARYAILAGLHRGGFVPENAEHVGYLLLNRAYLQVRVTVPDESRNSPGSLPVAVFETLVLDEVATPDSAAHVPAAGSRIVLLWFDQDAFRDEPLSDFADLADAFKYGTPNSRREMANVQSAIIGPADSDGLRQMARELARCQLSSDCAATRNPRAVYSPYATAADRWVLDNPAPINCAKHLDALDDEKTLAATVSRETNGRVRFYRTLADDCTVIHNLYAELQNRGLDDVDQVVIIAERDSLYARLMGSYFGGCFTAATAGTSAAGVEPPRHPHCYTYLRGLDGLSASPPTPSDPSQASSTTTPASANSSKTSNAATPESSTGPGQLDYLRRLVADIAARRHEQSCESRGRYQCIRAIGVLGSDVYDKLLVLQALRRAFPRTIFFTTDLDARLLDAPNLNSTRHMIIGSAFGLELRPRLQGDVPPFRDSYQTASYLASMLAATQLTSGVVEDTASQAVAAWTSKPRIFEIGRTDAFDLVPADSPGTPDMCSAADILRCAYIVPRPAGAFWHDPSRSMGLEIGIAVATLALLGVWLALAPRSVRGWNARRKLIVGGAAILVLAVTASIWRYVITPTGGANLPLFSGANIWAALIVEVLATGTVVCLAIRGQRVLSRSAAQINQRFGFAHDTRKLLQHREAQLMRLPGWARLLACMGLPNCLPSEVTPDRTPVDPVSPIEDLIARYLYNGRGAARFMRVALITVLSGSALMALDYQIGTNYIEVGVLTLSGKSHEVGRVLSVLSFFAIEFLVLWVADAMMLSRAFIRELTRSEPDWPPKSLELAGSRFALDTEALKVWSNLQIVADRTEVVAGLVWYPALVIIAMGVCAFTVEFGPFSFVSDPLSLLINGLIAILAAMLLRQAAESLRHKSIEQLDEYRSRLARSQSLDRNDAATTELEHLLARIEDLQTGAFAPYSQQPLVKAVLIPGGTYGATLLLQYLNTLGR